MKTLKCGIYEYSSSVETDVVLFFEVQKEEDDFEVVGWAKFDASRKGWLKRQPTQSGLFNYLPEEIRECWNVVVDQTPAGYPYRAEISEGTVKIFDDGKLWLTLTV